MFGSDQVIYGMYLLYFTPEAYDKGASISPLFKATVFLDA